MASGAGYSFSGHYRGSTCARKHGSCLLGAMGLGGVIGLFPRVGAGDTSRADSVVKLPGDGRGHDPCGSERIRLLGIDAPELPGDCRNGRVCAPGDPLASTASLARAISPDMRITRVGQDRYGRALAMVAGALGDLSCWQPR